MKCKLKIKAKKRGFERFTPGQKVNYNYNKVISYYLKGTGVILRNEPERMKDCVEIHSDKDGMIFTIHKKYVTGI